MLKPMTLGQKVRRLLKTPSNLFPEEDKKFLLYLNHITWTGLEPLSYQKLRIYALSPEDTAHVNRLYSLIISERK